MAKKVYLFYNPLTGKIVETTDGYGLIREEEEDILPTDEDSVAYLVGFWAGIRAAQELQKIGGGK